MKSSFTLVPTEMELHSMKMRAPGRATEVRTRNARMVLTQTIGQKTTARHVAMKWPIDFLAPTHLLMLNVQHNTLLGDFVFKEVFFLPLCWHAVGENFMLTLFVFSHDTIYEFGVDRICNC